MEEVYHILTRSIAGFKIFNSDDDFFRMKEVLRFYQAEKQPASFSHLNRLSIEKAHVFRNKPTDKPDGNLIEIIAYCLMPTHIHLVLRQLKDNGISKFMSNILNSYSRYFNLKHNRKGPLWEGRFKKIMVENDDQLLHLTRYIHLNPVTAYLVNRPEDWFASSYHEYIMSVVQENRLCNCTYTLDTNPTSYKRFVEDNISYQRELAKIKHLAMDD